MSSESIIPDKTISILILEELRKINTNLTDGFSKLNQTFKESNSKCLKNMKKLSKSIGDAVKVSNSFSKCNFQSDTKADKKSNKRKSSCGEVKIRKKKKKLANMDLDYGDLLKLYAAKQRKSTPIREVFQESNFCSFGTVSEINNEGCVKEDGINGKKMLKRKKSKKNKKTANLSEHVKPSNRLSDIVEKLHKFNATYLSDCSIVIDDGNKINNSFVGNTEVPDKTGESNGSNCIDKNGNGKTSIVISDDNFHADGVIDTSKHPSAVTTDENCFTNLNKKDVSEATKENPLTCQFNILSGEVDKSLSKPNDCADVIDSSSGEANKQVSLEEMDDFAIESEKTYDGIMTIVENIDSEVKPTKKQLIDTLLNYT